MAFWRRKNTDRFITLGLNEPTPMAKTSEQKINDAPLASPTVDSGRVETVAPETTAPPALAPVAMEAVEPTPAPTATTPAPPPVKTEVLPSPRPAPVRSSSFSNSILGLDRSIEELQAEEAALEQAFANRFRRAVAATRESLSEKIDTVFQGRKQIDAELLDELEEALIAADIGVRPAE